MQEVRDDEAGAAQGRVVIGAAPTPISARTLRKMPSQLRETLVTTVGAASAKVPPTSAAPPPKKK